jgi:hypothetical protein
MRSLELPEQYRHLFFDEDGVGERAQLEKRRDEAIEMATQNGNDAMTTCWG